MPAEQAPKGDGGRQARRGEFVVSRRSDPAAVAEKVAGAMVALERVGRLSRCVRQCAAQRSGDGVTSQPGDGREALGVTVATSHRDEPS